MNIREALETVLKHVDWTNQSSGGPDEVLCSAIPHEIIKKARKALDEDEDEKLRTLLKASIDQHKISRASSL